jgi:hypothetical protein
MSVLERHPELKEPMEQIEFRPPTEPPSDSEKPVRWIAWTFSILVVAAAAIAALILAGETTEPFDEIYESGSGLAYGAVHEPGFEVGFRWAGESDMTLEEFDMFQAYEASVGEADRVFERYIVESGFTAAELAALQASTGEADRVLIQSVGPVSPRTFTPEELAALQASVGSADLKYLQMATTG